MHIVAAWLNLKNIMLSERSLTPKSKYCIFLSYEVLEQAKPIYGGGKKQLEPLPLVVLEWGMDWERTWAQLLSLSIVFLFFV